MATSFFQFHPNCLLCSLRSFIFKFWPLLFHPTQIWNEIWYTGLKNNPLGLLSLPRLSCKKCHPDWYLELNQTDFSWRNTAILLADKLSSALQLSRVINTGRRLTFSTAPIYISYNHPPKKIPTSLMTVSTAQSHWLAAWVPNVDWIEGWEYSCF